MDESVIHLNNLLKYDRWEQFRTIEGDSKIIQTQPNGSRIETPLKMLLSGDNQRKIYITEENFSEKAPKIHLMLSISHGFALKITISIMNYVWNICSHEGFPNGYHQFIMFIQIYREMLVKMLNSLKYVSHLIKFKRDIQKIDTKNVVYEAINYLINIIDAVEYPVIDVSNSLLNTMNRLILFITNHYDPVPDYITNPKAPPIFIEVNEAMNLTFQEKINHFKYVIEYREKEYFKTYISGLGFKFDANDQVLTFIVESSETNNLDS